MKELMDKIVEFYGESEIELRLYTDGQIDIIKVLDPNWNEIKYLDCFDSLIELKTKVGFNKNL